MSGEQKLLSAEVPDCPLDLGLGIDQEVGAGNDSLSCLQAAGDLIVAFPIWVGFIDKLPAYLNEARFQSSRSLIDKY